ncbi:hypothetical protein GQ53DRAFT_686558 [Thozetella sp. PMI_491]|nr:hypothetical protein GQ53DRAFT_686558 [Thozetella sp. PMI_491]
MHYDPHHMHRSCPPKMLGRFERFQRLPAEIRNMIWEYSLPDPRVYEVLDAPNAKQRTPAHQGLMFANVHPEPPPALSAVCRESRYFVLHTYKPLTLGTTTKYVDLSRDILLLEPYLLIKRLHRTLHFMSQIPLVRDNINRLALGTSYGVYTGICHPVLSWKVSKNNMSKLLTQLAKFPRLKTLVFIVHQEFQFEFDFRYPPTLNQQFLPGMPVPHQQLPLPTAAPHQSSPLPAPAPAGYPALLPNLNPSLPTLAPAPPPLPTPVAPAAATATAQRLPPSPLPHLQTSTTAGPPLPLAPRPQLVHQAYRFKFDIEANINHTPRRPHLNELLYYPLDIDEDSDEWDLNDPAEGGEWCDPWPTNDDWRRFRRRFQRAINMTLETGNGLEGESRAGIPSQRGCYGDERGRPEAPALKGASLLWRYTRGGYV